MSETCQSEPEKSGNSAKLDPINVMPSGSISGSISE